MSFLLPSSFLLLTLRATLTINTIGCTSYLHELAARVDKPVETVIRYEAARILGQCISRTKARSRERIVTQVNFRNRTLWANGDPDNPKQRGSFVAGFGKRGEGWLFETSNWNGKGKRPRLISGKSFHPMEFFHWSDERWARWQSHLAAIQAKLHDVTQHARSRGVSKATWLQIARDLGLESLLSPSPPAYVKSAISRDGHVYRHGFGRQFRSPAQFFLELENNSNLVINRLDGAFILRTAIERRRKSFYDNIERDVFSTVANISRRYPGISVL
jgi:hypothetical protein